MGWVTHMMVKIKNLDSRGQVLDILITQPLEAKFYFNKIKYMTNDYNALEWRKITGARGYSRLCLALSNVPVIAHELVENT